MNAIYDHEQIANLRGRGWTWADVSTQFPGSSGKQLRDAHHRWKKRQAGSGKEQSPPDIGTPPGASSGSPPPPNGDTVQDVNLTGEDLKRVKSLEDLVELFDVDPEDWEVERFWVTGNSWDQNVREGLVAHQYKVTAQFRRRVEKRIEVGKAALQDLLEDIAAYSARGELVRRRPSSAFPNTEDGQVLALLAVKDAHLGMLAWGEEVGEDYDLDIAQSDYVRASTHLLDVAGDYDLERIVMTVGDDLFHVDGMATDAKGNRRGGATTRGTTQDLDTRLRKLYRATTLAVVEAIDYARQLAPVTVIMCSGNHDEETVFHLGVTLEAWYRNDPEVEVRNEPRKRKFYGWGANAWMLTHGEEVRRKRDNLAMIMATECPADIWVASEGGSREVLTGHNHIAMQGGYYPTAEVDESRAIRVRSLPGLTPEDAWHYEEGYKHQRAATLLVYRASGGIVGLHEFNL